MANLETRAAQSSDFDFAWDVYLQTLKPTLMSHVRKPWKDADEKKNFATTWHVNDTHIILLDGTPVGWLSCKVDDKAIEIEHGYVLEKYQRQDIGSILLAFIAGEAKRQNKTLLLDALKGAPSVDFFRDRGCTQLSETDILIKFDASTAKSVR